MQAVKISENVWWVGAIDWGLRDFHGYSTSRGTTYNAYLVVADKITLIDTVKRPFMDEMMARIATVIDPKKIEYIVSNHSEMDHSGSLPEVIDLVQPKKIFASKSGVEALKAHFHFGDKITEVKDGCKLSLGNMNITFLETKMLHWPDSMISYLDADQIVFSQDGFGMHFASSERFDDELPWETLEFEAKKYYANILTPFSSFVQKLLERLPTLGLKIKLVAPDHGPIWRKNFAKVLSLYAKWAEQKPTGKVVIIFDTMWQSTAKMASSISDGAISKGVDVVVHPLNGAHRSDIATDLIDAGALVVGTPTINNQMFPTVADVLTYVKGLKFKNLVGAAFGSYGWSGEGVKLVRKELEEMKIEIVAENINIKYVPTEEDLSRCFMLGEQIGVRSKV